MRLTEFQICFVSLLTPSFYRRVYVQHPYFANQSQKTGCKLYKKPGAALFFAIAPRHVLKSM